MLGMLDQQSLSAILLATQVQFVLSLFFAALTIGTTILADQYWGKDNKEAVEKVLAIALRLSFLISVLFFISALFFPGLLMRIFTNDTELIKLGIPYLRIVSVSYLCMGISQIYLCIMKNSGRTFRSTIYGSTTVVINLILNTVLIFGLFGMPKLEISGAAIATVIARIVELLLVLLENQKQDVVRIPINYLRERTLERFFALYNTCTCLWVVIVPLGTIAAFVLKLPVLMVYFLLNLDELIKLPAVYHHYKKHNWVKNLTKE